MTVLRSSVSTVLTRLLWFSNCCVTACGERKTGNLQVVVDCVEGFHFQRIGVCIVSMILVGVAAVSKPDLNQLPSAARYRARLSKSMSALE